MTYSFSLGAVRVGGSHRVIPHSGNARLHWATRARWNKAWRDTTGWAARAALGGGFAPGWLLSEVTITLYTIRLLDPDNAHAAIKPILDGLKGILIADDSTAHITLDVRQVRVSNRAHEHVEVSVTVPEKAVA